MTGSWKLYYYEADSESPIEAPVTFDTIEDAADYIKDQIMEEYESYIINDMIAAHPEYLPMIHIGEWSPGEDVMFVLPPENTSNKIVYICHYHDVMACIVRST